MKKLLILLSLSVPVTVYCQVPLPGLPGTYSDGITNLVLQADSTFSLKTRDDVFPYSLKSYESSGRWTATGNTIVLNPHKSKRMPQVTLSEKQVAGDDSIRVKINYQAETYDNEVLQSSEPVKAQLMTLYLNKPGHYYNLVHQRIRRVCAFSPRVKRQTMLDSSNSLTFSAEKITRLGIYTYGFDHPVELVPANPAANYFEITIVQPLDKDRLPRSKQVVIRKKNAYFYEYQGKVVTSGLLAPLRKM